MRLPNATVALLFAILALTLSTVALALSSKFSSVSPETMSNRLSESAEAKSDKHGGTGIFATTMIPSGSKIITIPASSLVCSPDELQSTVVDETVKSLCPQRCAEQEVWWLVTSLATWRLCYNKYDSFPAELGIYFTTEDHAKDLPWESAPWQLPMLWPKEVLDDVLNFCMESNDDAVVINACMEVRNRIQHLLDSAERLSLELEPRLKKYLINREGTASKLSVEKACQEALSLVMSRTLHLPNSGRRALVSDIDLANHSDEPNGMFDDGKTKDSPVHLVALRDIEGGEEITISYGADKAGSEKSASILFSGYGFVPEKLSSSTPDGCALQAAVLRGHKLAANYLISSSS